MNARNFIKPILLLFGVLTAAGMAYATKYPITVRDCRGKAVTISKEPVRIISTVPNNTEILFALGLESHIAGVGSWDDYPPAAKKKPKVGDHVTSAEKVISLRPDLVLAHGKLNQDVIPTLEKYGIPVVAIDPKTIDQVQKDVLLIGKITNREKQASTVAGKIASAKETVRHKISGIKTRPKVLVSIQADPLWAAGPQTFIDEIIHLSGAINVAADAKPGFNQFSSEAAVYRHPDIIIGTDKGSRQVFTHGLWKNTKAAQTGRVYEAAPDYLVRPGPRLAIGILTMAKLIHPEAFKKP